MRANTIEAARYHLHRMSPKDDPRVFARRWGSGHLEYLICANDVRPRSGGWVEVPMVEASPCASETTGEKP
jgi:hypothetical protein